VTTNGYQKNTILIFADLEIQYTGEIAKQTISYSYLLFWNLSPLVYMPYGLNDKQLLKLVNQWLPQKHNHTLYTSINIQQSISSSTPFPTLFVFPLYQTAS
jgi:hypothetical protein